MEQRQSHQACLFLPIPSPGVVSSIWTTIQCRFNGVPTIWNTITFRHDRILPLLLVTKCHSAKILKVKCTRHKIDWRWSIFTKRVFETGTRTRCRPEVYNGTPNTVTHNLANGRLLPWTRYGSQRPPMASAAVGNVSGYVPPKRMYLVFLGLHELGCSMADEDKSGWGLPRLAFLCPGIFHGERSRTAHRRIVCLLPASD